MSARAPGISGLAPQQLFFPFVASDTRDRLHQLYHEHFDKAERSAVKRAETQRRKLSLKVVDGRTLPFDSPRFFAILDRPIGLHKESDLDVQPLPDTDEHALPRVVGPEDGEKVEWSDQAIEELHEGLLLYSLNLLKSRGNAEEKQEILRWIWAPSVFCWVSRKVVGVNQMIPIHRRDLPFTYERCCAFAGQDPERLRSGLAYVLRTFVKGEGLPLAELGIDIDT